MNERKEIALMYTGTSAILMGALISVGIYHTGYTVIKAIEKQVKQIKENRKNKDFRNKES